MGTVKLRKEIREALKEEWYQGNELKVKIEELFNQVLLKQDEERKKDKKSLGTQKDRTGKI